MDHQITLNDRERDLLLDLLRTEQRELPVQAHRADRFEAREMLEHRVQLVDGLLHRLETQAAPTAPAA
jgi:hypothetical protein